MLTLKGIALTGFDTIIWSWAIPKSFIGDIWMIWGSLAASDMLSHLKTVWVLAQIWRQGANFWHSQAQNVSWPHNNGQSDDLGPSQNHSLWWYEQNKGLAATDMLSHLKTVWVLAQIQSQGANFWHSQAQNVSWTHNYWQSGMTWEIPKSFIVFI